MNPVSEIEAVEKFLPHLKSLRDDWSSDKPEKILNSLSKEKNKYRAGWVTAVFGQLETLNMAGVPFDENFVNRYKQLRDEYRAKVRLEDGLTSYEDIVSINTVLSEAIQFLESRYLQS